MTAATGDALSHVLGVEFRQATFQEISLRIRAVRPNELMLATTPHEICSGAKCMGP